MTATPLTVDDEMVPAETRRARLLDWQAISLVLDVGANRGQYARRIRQNGFDGRIVSFEPMALPFADLAQQSATDPRWESHQIALAETEGTAEINVAEDSVSSSLLPIEQRHLEVTPEAAYVAVESVQTRRLDELWPQLGSEHDRVWLKIDVQGYELAVIRRAVGMLRNLELIELELSLVPFYSGSLVLARHLRGPANGGNASGRWDLRARGGHA